MKTFFLLSTLSLCCYFNLEALHIIGGEMRYECLGNGQFEISARIYRDCAGGGASFDSPGRFSVYRSVGTDYVLVESTTVLIENIMSIEPSLDSCLLLPASICVERGDYNFEVNLVPTGSTYVVVYQRCCRNNVISNISLPGETGLTIAIEISPEAQNDPCNSSPTFAPSFNHAVCVQEELKLSHTALDAEGDELVYEFCNPLAGGGLGPGDPSDCDNIAPNPPCPPPYEAVEFLSPSFTDSLPLGFDISIDSSTGVITGRPELIGQYVYGVCIKEYRNGQLLSVSRRDIQLAVTECELIADCGVVGLSEAPPASTPQLYPNPAKDWLNVEWEGGKAAGELELQIVDLHGRTKTRMTKPTGRSNLQISLADWPDGLYFVQFGQEGQWQGSKRFAIIR